MISPSCTARILLFALFHEIRHATDGHVAYFAQAFGEYGLNESLRSVLYGPAPWVRLYCELGADADASYAIAVNTLQGHAFLRVSELSAREMLMATFLGVMILLAALHTQGECT